MGEQTTIPLFILLALYPTFAMIDYCRNHTFDKPTDMEILHFSKENSDEEFGIFDKFKCLHCCSHGYRSIEWFKNGLAYPWPTDVSTLIIHPESGNQTICSQQSTPDDSGRYWCVARNDTHFLRHEVLLQISGPSISMGWPKTTYRPRDQKASRGEFVRFYCEAFVGTIDLPDFQSEITWERYDLNQSFIDGKRVIQEAVFREEKRVLGSYLYFKQVMPEDYGEYTCKVRNLGDQAVQLKTRLKEKERIPAQPEDEKEQFWVFFSFVCPLILMVSVSTICILRLRFLKVLRNRVFPAPRLIDDTREDVLIIYHKSEEKEALKSASAMQKKNFCPYSLHSLQSKSQLEEELKAKENSYRSILALMGPCLMDEILSCEGLHQFIQGLLNIHFTISRAFLQVLPTPKGESTEWLLLKESLNKIYYTDKSNEKNNLKVLNLMKKKFYFRKKVSGVSNSLQASI